MTNSKAGELSPVSYQILVALGDSPKHGYGVMRDIEKRSAGRMQVLPGTLYSTIKKMLAHGVIEECAPPAKERDVDERRRYYRLTARGREVASEETERMTLRVRSARKKGFAPAR